MACSPTSGRHARRARVAGAVVASVFSITDTAPLVAAEAQPAGPPGRWRQVWADEFEGPQGARPAPHWFFFDGWGKTRWRDAWYTEEDAFLDGQGHLVIRSRLDPADGGKAKTAYLQTYDWKVPQARWTTFGPGHYIEARLNLAGLQARAQWAAFWLFDPSDTYDGDPANGTEIDVLEYVVIAGEGNAFHVANHWGPQGAAWGHEGRRIDASAYGIDLRAGCAIISTARKCGRRPQACRPAPATRSCCRSRSATARPTPGARTTCSPATRRCCRMPSSSTTCGCSPANREAPAAAAGCRRRGGSRRRALRG